MDGYIASQKEIMAIMSYANIKITEIARGMKEPYSMHKLFCVCDVSNGEIIYMRICSLRSIALVFPYDDKNFDSVSELGFMDAYSFENHYIVRVS